jgi:tetratricopeptide (TPR) repeat protein
MPHPIVFISHASEDRDAAGRLCAFIEARGVPCWIAPRDVRPGRDWDEEIIDAIGATAALILVLSRHSNESVHVKHEVERASSKAKAIFTVRIEDVLPSKKIELHVSSRHWLDTWAAPLDATADAIVRSLEGMGERVPSREGVASEGPAPRGTTAGSVDLALVRLGASPFTYERERILAEGLRYVREGSIPIVLLQGLSGMGKTVLLRELTRRLRPDFAQFSAFSFDGPASREPSFFLEDVNELLTALGCGLPAEELRKGEPVRVLESLCARIAGQRILFVLDAVDGADPTLLSKFAACLMAAGEGSRCIMAARSRPVDPLPAHVVAVGPLQEGEARDFVGQYARLLGLDLDSNELCARVPPAIRTHPQALATLLANLHDLPLELLLLGDLPEGARAPGALVQEVVRALSDVERSNLAFLSLLADVDVTAALGVLGLPPPTGLAPSLKTLLARSLVVKAGPAYSVPSIVRDALSAVDARTCLAQGSHVADAIAAAASAVHQPESLRSALPSVCAQSATRLAESGRWDEIRRAVPAAFLDALNLRGFWKEYCLLLKLGIEAASAMHDRPLAVALRLRLARKSLQTHDLAEGRAALTAAEDAIGADGDTPEHALLYSHKASFAEIDGDPRRAFGLLDRSRAILRVHGDTRGLALIEKLSGNIHLRLRDRAGARQAYEAALGLLADAPDSKDAIEALMGAAQCDMEDGHPHAAEARLRDALARCRATGYSAGVPRALVTLASALEKLGRVDEALRVGREAVQAAKGLGPVLASAAGMLVWRLENVTSPGSAEGGKRGDGQQGGA